MLKQLKDLFNPTVNPAVNPTVNTTTKIAPTTSNNSTYQQYGTSWAGKNNASIQALTPALQKIVISIKAQQSKNIQLQQTYKQQTKNEIATLQGQIVTENNNLTSEEKELQTLQEKIEENKEKISDLAHGNESGPTKVARINLWIGGIILGCITIYLIVFYSSAAFSAFFKDFGTDAIPGVSDTILNGKAISEAWSYGPTAVMFISLLPFLFMGLGYIIYQITEKNEIRRTFKIGALYSLTFIFDTLIAYHICNKIYGIWVLTQLADQPQYSMKMAFNDPNFWIIIFCGFVAYVIWGLVFSFVMTALNNLDTNKEQIKGITNVINGLQDKCKIQNAAILSIKNNIAQLNAQLCIKQNALNNNALIDLNAIKLELNNFIGGWIAYMKLVVKTDNEINQAVDTFNQFISSLG